MTTTPLSISARLPKIHLDKSLVGRLEALAASVMRRSPDVGERLIDEIARAKLVAPDKMRGDVVTIGSEVTYRDLGMARLHTVTVVYPEDADIDQGRISVLTPVGVALLGLSPGATIFWNTREDEKRHLEVLAVKPPGTE
ncbi:nucleoside diphosphate kinase regulator [Neotabrizicola sp. sgz301269]|uniref:nucleoside diphosphate kinase regulator n=1 Tax=Neotabrizicola sp. sgz301269 TaxID=3276282 RepID=UPI00376FE5C3